MRKSFSFLKPVLFLFFIILLAIACNNETTAPAKTEAPAETPNPAPTNPVLVSATITGYLDTLFIDSASFEALGRPPHKGPWTFFRFYINTNNLLTLAGWTANNSRGVFHGGATPTATPDVVLLISNQSPIKVNPGNYFGNLVLRPKQYDSIISKLKLTHSKSVLFCPLDPAKNLNQITYDIYVSDRPTAKGLFTRVDPTGQSLYPSPPRNSQ